MARTSPVRLVQGVGPGREDAVTDDATAVTDRTAHLHADLLRLHAVERIVERLHDERLRRDLAAHVGELFQAVLDAAVEGPSSLVPRPSLRVVQPLLVEVVQHVENGSAAPSMG